VEQLDGLQGKRSVGENANVEEEEWTEEKEDGKADTNKVGEVLIQASTLKKKVADADGKTDIQEAEKPICALVRALDQDQHATQEKTLHDAKKYDDGNEVHKPKS
jgi:hypothetical protein